MAAAGGGRGDRLEELELSGEEVERLSQAFRDERFRQLFREYAEEISAPENRRLYEQEIRALEQGRGVDARFVHPQPGHALRTSLGGRQLCYVNVCSNELLGKPECQPGPGGQHWRLPYSLAPGRQDLARGATDKHVIYDVVFHPEALRLAASSQHFRDMLDATALEGVEKQFGVTLDKRNVKTLKLQYKGLPQATLLRSPLPGAPQGPAAGPDDPLGFPYPYEAAPARPGSCHQALETEPQGTPEPKEQHLPDAPTEPHYTITHRAYVDLQDYRHARDAAPSTVPKELLVTIHLPLLRSASNATLDIHERQLSLESEEPAYKLRVTLPYPVDDTLGTAKFNKAKRQLLVTLPVVAQKCQALMDRHQMHATGEVDMLSERQLVEELNVDVVCEAMGNKDDIDLGERPSTGQSIATDTEQHDPRNQSIPLQEGQKDSSCSELNNVTVELSEEGPSVVELSEVGLSVVELLESPSVVELPVKGLSILKLPEEGLSVVELLEERLSVDKLLEEGPSVVEQPEEGPSVVEQPEEGPSVVEQPEERPSVVELPVKELSIVKLPEEALSIVELLEERLSVVKPLEEGPSVVELPEERPLVVELLPEEGPSVVELLPEEGPSVVELLPEEGLSVVELLPEEGPSVVELLPEEGLSVVELLPEEGPSVVELLPEEGPSVVGLLPEEGPSVVGLLPEEGPSVVGLLPEEGLSVVELLPEEGPSVVELLPEEGPSVVELLPEERPSVVELLPEEGPSVVELLPEEGPSVVELSPEGPSAIDLSEEGPLVFMLEKHSSVVERSVFTVGESVNIVTGQNESKQEMVNCTVECNNSSKYLLVDSKVKEQLSEACVSVQHNKQVPSATDTEHLCPKFHCTQDTTSITLIILVPCIDKESLKAEVSSCQYKIQFSAEETQMPYTLVLCFNRGYKLNTDEVTVCVSKHNAVIQITKASDSHGLWEKFCIGVKEDIMQEHLFVTEDNVDRFLDSILNPPSVNWSAPKSGQPVVEVLGVTDGTSHFRIKEPVTEASDPPGHTEQNINNTDHNIPQNTVRHCPQNSIATNPAQRRAQTANDKPSRSETKDETMTDLGRGSGVSLKSQPAESSFPLSLESEASTPEFRADDATGESATMYLGVKQKLRIAKGKAERPEAEELDEDDVPSDVPDIDKGTVTNGAVPPVIQEIDPEDGSVRVISDHTTRCAFTFQNPLIYDLD